MHTEGLTTNSTNEATLIATARYVPTNPEDVAYKRHLLFKRPPPEASEHQINSESESSDVREHHWPQWELLAIAVHPSLQGRRLASTLLAQWIVEIKTRCAAFIAPPTPSPTKQYKHDINSTSDDRDLENGNAREELVVGKGKRKVMLMLSTMRELNESYYRKRGFLRP